MGRKVFVSYKYRDDDVLIMPDVTQPTWPCDYVDYIKNEILSSDDIYKGEKSNEDISIIFTTPYLSGSFGQEVGTEGMAFPETL